MKRSEKDYKRIVVKLGSSAIVKSSGGIDKPRLRHIVSCVCDLYDRGSWCVLVSSGAIAAGMSLLAIAKRPKNIACLQAVASIGQIELISLYSRFFKQRKRHCSQVLLTWEDFDSRGRYINAKNTLLEAMKYNSVPVVNENDTVSADEIKFGDNDKLSALVANLIDADLLIMLSDVDGLYNQKRELVRVVERIDSEIQKMACDTYKHTCVGGMSSKLEAARIVTDAGTPCVIANGKREGIISQILDNDYLGTLFLPKTKGLVARKRWIAFSSKPKGKIIVDKGAEVALIEKNRSLLFVGIVGLEGDFSKGDTVQISGPEGREFARGVVNYSVDELRRTKKATKLSREVVHRNNLVII